MAGRSYSRFEAAVVGSGQSVVAGGLELVSNGATLAGHARLDIDPQPGEAGAEVALFGAEGATVDYSAVLGFVDDAAAASVLPGRVVDSAGWDVHAGALWGDGALIATNVEVPAMQVPLGLSIDATLNPPRARWYVGHRLVVYADLHPSGATSPGVWLGDEDDNALVDDAGNAYALG